MGSLARGITGFDRDDAERGVLYGWDLQSTNNPVVAAAAGTQLAATPLLGGINVVTAAQANASVLLPRAGFGLGAMPEPGLCIAVFNTSVLNAINVFASDGDTINGLAGAVAASQMPNSIVYFTCVAINAAGVSTWLATGIGNGYASSGNGSFPTYSSIDGLAATVGGSQATAALITASTAGVTPGVAGTDAVRLPPAKAGMEVTIINKSAGNAMIVFPASAAQGGIGGGDIINNQAANSSLSIAAATVLLFYCLTDGTWWSK